MNIINDYMISLSTIAIVPHRHPQYQTMIIDVEGIFYTSERSEQIISRSCITNGASYNGRRDAAIYLLNYIQKTPILISEADGMIAIPTHSPDREECAWIFYHHIKKVKTNEKNGCIIQFHNYRNLELKVSSQTMRQQIHKAAVIYSIFCIKKIHFSFD